MGVCGIAEVGVSVKDVPDNSGVGGISTVCGLGVTLMSVGLNTSIGLEMERRCVKSGRVCVGLGDSACGRSFTISRSLSESAEAAVSSSLGYEYLSGMRIINRKANILYCLRPLRRGIQVFHCRALKGREISFVPSRATGFGSFCLFN